MHQYIFLIAPIVAWGLSQLIKLTLNHLNGQYVRLSDIVSSGNMPSSHVCGATALTVVIGAKQGWSSSLFALGFVFSVLIAYDSVGVRRAAGEGAASINAINKKIGLGQQPLHVYKGHTVWEVLAGVVLGAAVAAILNILL